jgi:hypothetical protein
MSALQSGSNTLKEIRIIKAIGRRGVDFNEWTAEGKRCEMTLQEPPFVLFKPFQVGMAGVSLYRSHAGEEAFQENGTIGLT